MCEKFILADTYSVGHVMTVLWALSGGGILAGRAATLGC